MSMDLAPMTRRPARSGNAPAPSVLKVVLQKSIYTQIRQLVVYISHSRGQVEEFVGELTSAKRLHKCGT